MTAADRLRALAGQTGTAAALLLLIGAGSTAGDALVNYSGLATGAAEQHLLADRASQQAGGGWSAQQDQLEHILQDDNEVMMIVIAMLGGFP